MRDVWLELGAQLALGLGLEEELSSYWECSKGVVSVIALLGV